MMSLTTTVQEPFGSKGEESAADVRFPSGSWVLMFAEGHRHMTTSLHAKKQGGMRVLFLAVMCSSLPISCATSGVTDKEIPYPQNPLAAVIELYQGPLNHLSAVKSSGCPMYPSCSQYCKESVERHGFFVGWMMTCDRLMRCGRDEAALSPRVMVDGELKYYDPVQANEILWDDNGDRQ